MITPSARIPFRVLCIGVLSPLIAWSVISAQTTTGSLPQKKDSTIKRSPFIVTAGSDSGYAASETLAGTRLKTQLRDVGASLTDLTPEFHQDLAVNSLEQALLPRPRADTYDGAMGDNGSAMRNGTGPQHALLACLPSAGPRDLALPPFVPNFIRLDHLRSRFSGEQIL